MEITSGNGNSSRDGNGGGKGGGQTSLDRMTPRELYRFDLQGFLVVRNVLTDSELSRLNEAIDANQDRLVERPDQTAGSRTLEGGVHYQAGRMLEWPKPWCDPFRSLIAHPRIICYLNALLGRGWHLDHDVTYFQSPKGAGGLAFHLGEYYHVDGAFYTYKAGQIRTGLTVLQWVLADQGGDLGGFACIPGSHKSNFPRPLETSLWQEDQDVVVCPEVKAGDLLIFSEATTHGTLPWRGDHDRRAILCRYAPRYVQFASGFHTYQLPEWVEELDEVSRGVLEPAYMRNRPVIRADRRTEKEDWIEEPHPPRFFYE